MPAYRSNFKFALAIVASNLRLTRLHSSLFRRPGDTRVYMNTRKGVGTEGGRTPHRKHSYMAPIYNWNKFAL